MTIEQVILDTLQRLHGGVSFVEIEQALRKHGINPKGEHAIEQRLSDGRPSNIYVWFGLSQEVVEALQALKTRREIKFTPVAPLIYYVDGSVPTVPVAKQLRQYKQPHWAPMSISLYRKAGV